MSCADACIDMDFDGSNDFHSATTRRARKAHRCEECAEPILPGDQHEYAVGKDTDAGFFSARTCLLCVEVREAFVCGGFLYGMLWEECEQSLFPAWKRHGTMVDCLAKLTTLEAREHCRHQYAEWLGEDDTGENTGKVERTDMPETTRTGARDDASPPVQAPRSA